MSQTIELSALWDRMWAARKTIAALVLGSTILVGAISFVLPPWYTAECSLLPPSEEESGLGLVSLLKGIGVPGVKVPTQAAPADVFLAILESRRLAEEMVDRFGLKERYKKRLMVDAVKDLRRHTRFQLSAAGLVEVSVEDRDPRVAAEMANAYVELLDRFNRDVRMTKGRRMRLFVEQRLKETKDELELAEARLAEYQAKHKAVALSPELSSSMETAGRLYAERTALQVRLGVVRTYSIRGSDEEVQTLQRLSQIDRQLQALPGTGLELARLFRDVKTLEQLWMLMTGQYEEARITEARDIATVEVLDVASPPERKSWPRRGIMIAVTFMLSLGVGVTFALMRDARSSDRSSSATGA